MLNQALQPHQANIAIVYNPTSPHSGAGKYNIPRPVLPCPSPIYILELLVAFHLISSLYLSFSLKYFVWKKGRGPFSYGSDPIVSSIGLSPFVFFYFPNEPNVFNFHP
jgi:hypothetical protein